MPDCFTTSPLRTGLLLLSDDRATWFDDPTEDPVSPNPPLSGLLKTSLLSLLEDADVTVSVLRVTLNCTGVSCTTSPMRSNATEGLTVTDVSLAL